MNSPDIPTPRKFAYTRCFNILSIGDHHAKIGYRHVRVDCVC